MQLPHKQRVNRTFDHAHSNVIRVRVRGRVNLCACVHILKRGVAVFEAPPAAASTAAARYHEARGKGGGAEGRGHQTQFRETSREPVSPTRTTTNCSQSATRASAGMSCRLEARGR